MIGALRTADEGQLITKRKIQVIVRKYLTKKVTKEVKKSVIKKLGMKKMKKMGKKKVLKVVRRYLRKEAIVMLRDLGYKSACRGACGRRMKVVATKIKAIKKKNEIKIHKLEEFKHTVIIKQLKSFGIIVNSCITKGYYKDKQTFLNTKFAKSEITKGQLTRYLGMLRKWVTLTRKQLKARTKGLKAQLKSGEIPKADMKGKMKLLKRCVKPEVKITKE